MKHRIIGSVLLGVAFVFFALSYVHKAFAISSDIIPASRLVDWTPGVSVGVPDGIKNRTHLIDVTQAPYNADKTGATDSTAAIAAAIAAAQPEDVVYLPAGTYKVDSINVYGNNQKSNITIRGAGMDKTIIDCRNTSTCVSIGTGSDWNWSWPTGGVLITAGQTKGSTQITLSDASQFPVGHLVNIFAKSDPSLPVISVAGYDNNRRQMTRVTGKTGNTLSIFPPLYTDFGGQEARAFVAQQQVEYFGLEGMTLDGTQAGFQFGIFMEQTYGSWIKDVKVKGTKNFSLYLFDSLNGEVRHSWLDVQDSSTPNHSGLIMGNASASLIEDNVILDSFPDIEVNAGSSGNVFAYNFMLNQNGLIGIDTNHSPHNAFNLYEGNVVHNLMADGYFGSVSDDTIYRNWIHGTVSGWAISLKRMTRNYSVIGNILGRTGQSNGDVSFGQPNIGNGAWSGEVQPSQGVYWADWNPTDKSTLVGTLTTRTDNYHGVLTLSSGKLNEGSGANFYITATSTFNAMISSPSGNTYQIDTSPWSYSLPAAGTAFYDIWPGSGGFQELDKDVQATTILKGNYYEGQKGIPAAESVATALPSSLYLSAKPSWFGSLAWPPFDPLNPNQSFDAIPAGYRWGHSGQETPGVTVSAPSTYSLSVSKSGTGSGTVTSADGRINCGSTCSDTSVPSGTKIVLSAAPATGSTFSGWSGGNCSGTGTCEVTGASAVTASFAADQVSGGGSGGSPAPQGIRIVSGPTVSDISQTTARISWTTSSEGDSQVEYGLTQAYGSVTSRNAQTSVNHGETLSGLAANTTYHYRTISKDASNNQIYSGDATFVTLSEPARSSSSSRSGGGGGGGGSASSGGGNSSSSKLPAVPVTASSGTVSASPSLSQFIELLISIGAIPPEKAESARKVVSAPSTPSTFSRSMGMGTRGDDVKNLQGFLISKGYLGAQSATGYFGSATAEALKKYQLSVGVPATGYFGDLTRSVLNRGVSAGASSGSSVSSATVFRLDQGLEFGSYGAAVKILQKMLNSDKDTTVASSGMGSLGSEAEYFDRNTENAVKKFQVKYGIAKQGDAAYGYVGPATRAKLNQLYSK